MKIQKMNYPLLSIVCLLSLFFSCKKSTEQATPASNTSTLYFPPIGSTEWQSTDPSTLSWDASALNDLHTWLGQNNTKAFIILKDGKIVVEKYFGTFTADSSWYWASAGKTMTGMLLGIAQQEGYLNISQPSSKYLGTGWTSLPVQKEALITIKNQLSMSSGLDDGVADSDCTLPSCLVYKADAGSRWAYHNAPYTLLDKVIENATGTTFSTYFQQKIMNKIGMEGLWFKSGYNNIYYSKARSMARFGLLLLNKGKWNQTAVLQDSLYFNAQISSSQNLNPSYGYLTWLNGKNAFMVPTSQYVAPGYLIPAAPADLFAALGKNDQKIYVVPSQRLVIIRLGNSSGTPLLAVSGFDNEIWTRLKGILKY